MVPEQSILNTPESNQQIPFKSSSINSPKSQTQSLPDGFNKSNISFDKKSQLNFKNVSSGKVEGNKIPVSQQQQQPFKRAQNLNRSPPRTTTNVTTTTIISKEQNSDPIPSASFIPSESNHSPITPPVDGIPSFTNEKKSSTSLTSKIEVVLSKSNPVKVVQRASKAIHKSPPNSTSSKQIENEKNDKLNRDLSKSHHILPSHPKLALKLRSRNSSSPTLLVSNSTTNTTSSPFSKENNDSHYLSSQDHGELSTNLTQQPRYPSELEPLTNLTTQRTISAPSQFSTSHTTNLSPTTPQGANLYPGGMRKKKSRIQETDLEEILPMTHYESSKVIYIFTLRVV